jgi:hypothetical protein
MRVCAIAILVAAAACGGSKKMAAPSAPGVAGTPPPSPARTELEQLDRAIADDLARLKLPRPTLPLGTPPPTMTALGLPTADPTCKRAETETCADVCKLADSICGNAKRICEIAAELADDWANEKCTSGGKSCEAARERCCDCT